LFPPSFILSDEDRNERRLSKFHDDDAVSTYQRRSENVTRSASALRQQRMGELRQKIASEQRITADQLLNAPSILPNSPIVSSPLRAGSVEPR
jgi:hypothetical protein